MFLSNAAFYAIFTFCQSGSKDSCFSAGLRVGPNDSIHLNNLFESEGADTESVSSKPQSRFYILLDSKGTSDNVTFGDYIPWSLKTTTFAQNEWASYIRTKLRWQDSETVQKSPIVRNIT